jgi:hypothetical protein
MSQPFWWQHCRAEIVENAVKKRWCEIGRSKGHCPRTKATLVCGIGCPAARENRNPASSLHVCMSNVRGCSCSGPMVIVLQSCASVQTSSMFQVYEIKPFKMHGSGWGSKTQNETMTLGPAHAKPTRSRIRHRRRQCAKTTTREIISSRPIAGPTSVMSRRGECKTCS